MKAQEYYNKYEEQIYEALSVGPKEAIHRVCHDIFVEFVKEVATIQEARKTQSISGMASIIKEQNQKWNALGNILYKQYGNTIIERNAIVNILRLKIPTIKDYL